MNYNKYDEAYVILGYFNLGLEHYTRVRFMKDGSEEVFLTKDVKSGDFHSKEYNPLDVTEELVETVVDAVIEYKKEVEAKPSSIDATTPKDNTTFLNEEDNFLIEATSPKGEIIAFRANKLNDFVIQNNLDLESVKACLDGQQKTHRKWGFEKVE